MTTAAELQAKITQAEANMDRIIAFVTSGPTVSITIPGVGVVSSVAKIAADAKTSAAAAVQQALTGLDGQYSSAIGTEINARIAGDAATLLAAQNYVLQSFGSGSSWDRPAKPLLAARRFESNLQTFVTWNGSAWVDDGGRVRPTPAHLVDAVGITPVYALSLSRRLISTYTGPLARVQRASDGATLNFYSAIELAAFMTGPTDAITHIYNQASGAALTLGASFRAQVIDGVASMLNPSTANSRSLTDPSETVRQRFKDTSGATGYMVVGTPDNYAANGGDPDLIFISSGASVSAFRHGLRVSTLTSSYEVIGRRLDADTATTAIVGSAFGGVDVVGFNANNAAGRLRGFRNGVVSRDLAFPTTGNTENTTPLGGRIAVTAGMAFYEGVVWNAGFADAPQAALLNDQQLAWGKLYAA